MFKLKAKKAEPIRKKTKIWKRRTLHTEFNLNHRIHGNFRHIKKIIKKTVIQCM
jgi:hypothetical protein